MKRKDLEKELIALGWRVHRQGKHEIWKNGFQTIPVPRHSEINNFTAQSILWRAGKFTTRKV